jgi:hypothetical protein
MPRLSLLALALLALAMPSRAATVTVPGTLQIVPLDISIVTTGGTAVQALAPGPRTVGGWIQNPPAPNAVNLCIAETAVAAGTTSAGNTTCILPGQSYVLTPSPSPVSVISSDSAHAFSGQGYTE